VCTGAGVEQRRRRSADTRARTSAVEADRRGRLGREPARDAKEDGCGVSTDLARKGVAQQVAVVDGAQSEVLEAAGRRLVCRSRPGVEFGGAAPRRSGCMCPDQDSRRREFDAGDKRRLAAAAASSGAAREQARGRGASVRGSSESKFGGGAPGQGGSGRRAAHRQARDTRRTTRSGSTSEDRAPWVRTRVAKSVLGAFVDRHTVHAHAVQRSRISLASS